MKSAADQVRGQREREGIEADQGDVTGWRHVHLNGRYAFRDSGQAIDLDAIIKALKLE